MYYFALCFVMIFLIQPVKPFDMSAQSSDKYGPFILKSSEVEICRGPKTVHRAIIACNYSKNADDIIFGSFYVTVNASTKIDEIRIMVYTIKDNKKNLMWNYKYTDPCKHFAIGSIFAIHFKAEKCVVKPGYYTYEVNVTDMVQKFFGHAFFYGDYYFKVYALSKTGNFGCINIHSSFEKKL